MDTDPVIRFARDLAAVMASARDMLRDDAYAAVLPHLEALRLALPDNVPAPRAPRPGILAASSWPLDTDMPR